MEVKGIFGRQVVAADAVEPLIDNLHQTRQFITDRVYPFLQQFDVPAGTR